jgi:hypothetical protein
MANLPEAKRGTKISGTQRHEYLGYVRWHEVGEHPIDKVSILSQNITKIIEFGAHIKGIVSRKFALLLLVSL